ncbi:MAG: HAMP domain-containing sensor histidine kinase [Hyphomicrobiaceae bacterium]
MLARIFTQHVEVRADAELMNHLNQIAAALEFGPDGSLQVVVPPADPRFDVPGSGLYWQVDQPAGTRQRSRSLWDQVLILPDDHLPDGVVHRHEVPGPGHTQLRLIERALAIGPDSRPQSVRLSVALDRSEIEKAGAEFRKVLFTSLMVLGLALLAALWLQVQVGLRPLAALRSALNKVREGGSRRVEGQFPTEVKPLVDDMNALLEREQRNIERARERASDLAHGFKTPLSVMSAVSRDLARDGRSDNAKEIDAQVDVMSRHVQRELALARTAGSSAVGRTSISVKPIVDRVTRALQRIAADRGLRWENDIDPAAVFPGDENDLLEMVGNLADNAAKWATSRVVIKAASRGHALILAVDDDGPGIAPGTEAAALKRGRRLDETTAGSGLGLSIVTKMVEAHGGTIRLDRAAIGGLSVHISIPLARALD